MATIIGPASWRNNIAKYCVGHEKLIIACLNSDRNLKRNIDALRSAIQPDVGVIIYSLSSKEDLARLPELREILNKDTTEFIQGPRQSVADYLKKLKP